MEESSYEGLQKDIRQLELPRLETWENRYPDRDYSVRIDIPEFTCVCPRTALPDFATLTLDYVPDRRCVELKSLKFYIVAYRQLGIFHEHVVNRFLDDFVRDVEPRSVEVEGVFNARGGVATTVRAAWRRPDGL